MPHLFTNARHALLLQKLDLLRRVRNGALARLFGYRLIPMKTAISLKAVMVLAYIGGACLIPMLTPDDIGTGTKLGQGLVHYRHFIINGGAILLFHVGILIGGSQIHNIFVAMNDKLLSYPILLSDLALHRAMDVYRDIIHICIYFVLPLMLLMSVALGWSTLWTIAMTALTIIVMTAVYLAGASFALAMVNRIPSRGPEVIFGGIFLISLALWLAFVQSYKAGYFDSDFPKWWGFANHQLSLHSYTSMTDNMIQQRWGVGQYLLSMLAGLGAVHYLAQTCVRSLDRVFQRVHAHAYDMTVQAQRTALRIGFAAFCRRLKLLPLGVRTLLAKDVLGLIRTPRLVLQIILFLGSLILIAYWKTSALDNPFVFALYVSSALVISRLFVEIIGHEKGNIMLIKQLYPSTWSYLSVRIIIAIVVSSLVLIPYWIMLIAISADFTILDILSRSPLLLLNIIMTSILVIFFSAAFAEFKPERFGKQSIGIHPAAMMGVYGLATTLTLFSYKLDMFLLSGSTDLLTLVLLIVTGAFLITSMFVLRWLGINKITNYA